MKKKRSRMHSQTCESCHRRVRRIRPTAAPNSLGFVAGLFCLKDAGRLSLCCNLLQSPGLVSPSERGEPRGGRLCGRGPRLVGSVDAAELVAVVEEDADAADDQRGEDAAEERAGKRARCCGATRRERGGSAAHTDAHTAPSTAHATSRHATIAHTPAHYTHTDTRVRGDATRHRARRHSQFFGMYLTMTGAPAGSNDWLALDVSDGVTLGVTDDVGGRVVEALGVGTPEGAGDTLGTARHRHRHDTTSVTAHDTDTTSVTAHDTDTHRSRHITAHETDTHRSRHITAHDTDTTSVTAHDRRGGGEMPTAID